MIDTVIHNDALTVLRGMADNSVDAIVSDPPAGISFMGKDWDNPDTFPTRDRKNGQGSTFGKSMTNGPEWSYNKRARDGFIAFMREVMTEALRVLKPGGHALIWALPRTSHWTATALEDAGFEVRDNIYHLFSPESKIAAFYSTLSQEQRNLFEQILDSQGTPSKLLHCFGSGFPKSHNISVAIDKHLKAEREVVGTHEYRSAFNSSGTHQAFEGVTHSAPIDITKPATPEAQRWQGYGSALKPSCEEWILCRKPLAESSIAAQVLATGTGGLAIDACRVGATDKAKFPVGQSKATKAAYAQDEYSKNWKSTEDAHPSQRFPSHLLLSHSLWCVPRGTKRVRGNKGFEGHTGPVTINAYGEYTRLPSKHMGDEDGMETVEAYECAPDCPIAELDRQSGVRKSVQGSNGGASKFFGVNGRSRDNGYGDVGGSSRYFTNFPPDDYTPFLYQAKASRAERNRGCEDLPYEAPAHFQDDNYDFKGTKNPTMSSPLKGNSHPTVKSTSLMRWLIRLITPPDGIVLDPFCGSGSTLVACVQEQKHFIGIEQDASYVAIAQARIAHAQREQGVTVQVQEYECAPDCPVRILGEQSGTSKSSNTTRSRITPHAGSNGKTMNGGWNGQITQVGYGDSGNAARYFQQFAPDLWTQDMQDAEEVFIAEGGYEGEVSA